MSIDFFIIVWFWSMQYADGRVGKYHNSEALRFKTLAECEYEAKQRINKWPKDNQLSPDGTELRYADFHCIDVKVLSTSWAKQSSDNHPLPPPRPKGL